MPTEGKLKIIIEILNTLIVLYYNITSYYFIVNIILSALLTRFII